MKNLRFYLLLVTFWVLIPYQSFSQSFSFTYSGPTTVTVPFGSNSTGATYYFQYFQQGILIRPRLTISLDGTILTQGVCQGGDSFLPSSFVITFTPGNHTVTFKLSDLGQTSNSCYDAKTWQTEQFVVNSKYTMNIQNNFSGGTIYVDNLSVPKTAPYGRPSNNSENIQLGAIEQNDGIYNRIWNTSGINNSNWEIKRGNNVSTLSNSQNYTYTTQSGDNNSIITANLRKVTNITFQNNFIGVGNGGVIKVNNTQVSSPKASYSVVELNPITATAVSQSFNNIAYYFTNWSTGSTNSTETFYPTANTTITANFVGIAPNP